ncbi:precorrin-3B C(17)-methyltransferase [Rhodospirillaceae bacterium KN72]|uniref:Precorrin-3B C(17)-methyltransferase n=1 Tax=Pacificispira spongiicola TaxID=2729598 RepID=A0A7Y0HH97_9PROT|nr:precorrin-3B C(17)-methyltransferase [Pacificispira spongiicola]NMM45264.1 precorrin-3B C(17)-methyltransferase [Pacificispira spongiicola]
MPTETPIALIVLTQAGYETARRLKAMLPEIVIFGKGDRIDGADCVFDDAMETIRGLHGEGWTVVGLCAAGILVRALAGMASDKWRDAPVLALSEDGQVAVPLLGGHHGANKLACRFAELLGGQAAITTAGDRRLGFALDDPPTGWTLKTPDAVKAVTARLLAGETVTLRRECGDASWPPATAFREAGPGQVADVLITDRVIKATDGQVVLVPPTLALGIGCERMADAGGLRDFVRTVLSSEGLDPAAIAAIGSVDLKGDEPALKALSADLDRPVRLFAAAELEDLTPHLPNPSDVVFQEIGCHGVAEASVLALAGRDARFAVEKQRRGPYTCAVARARDKSVDTGAGKAPGRLFVVGIGPGDTLYRTGAAARAILGSDCVVGYRLYLDLARDLIGGKPTHDSELGEEAARARKALELAAQGQTVSLVCSGDPGIYALATLVFELIEATEDRALRAVDVDVVPGISAFQLAAARLGAPMGHDFCLISLSDLLTPVAAIRMRLKAAAEGDFVLAFYNPQSKRRRTLLPEARDILMAHRPPTTPVALCRQLGRPEESITVTTLADFDPAVVDMFTLVVIGSSETRAFDHAGTPRAFTPRGYAGKQT